MAQYIDDHVPLGQCRNAVEALHEHATEKQQRIQEEELIPGKEPNIWLNVTVKRIPPGHRMKPIKVPVVHPLVDPRTSSICLITKDPQREYKDLLETHGVKFISRVVGIEKLKGKFKPYEARRALLKENGMFLADDRVIPLLPKLLGKKWFDAKKQPIPVCLTRKDLKGELERSISSTYMNQNQGTCTSIKIANLSHTPAQVMANLQKALPVIVAGIKDGWANIQSLHIKTNSSVSLPIWVCALDASEEGRWHNLEAGDASESEKKDDGESSEEEAAVSKKREKSRKRESSPVEESEDLPRKRAKQNKDVPGSTVKPSKSGSDTVEPAKAVTPSTRPKSKPKPETAESVTQQPKGKTSSKAKDVASPAPAPSSKKPTSSSAKPTSVDDVKKSKTISPVLAEELKLKRDGKSFEKKKEKVLKHKVGKSVKSTLLGKKAAQD